MDHAQPLPAPPSLDLDFSRDARLARYNKRVSLPSVSTRKGTRCEVELGGPLDDVINAQARGINCCREPIALYFRNDKAGA